MLRRLVILVMLAAASSAIAAEPADTIQLSGDTAVAYSARGTAIFRGDLPFLLAYVGTDGQVFDTKEGKVRISPDGAPQVWVKCSELKGVASCANQSEADTQLTRAAGIPTCPGDPRCPKRRTN